MSPPSIFRFRVPATCRFAAGEPRRAADAGSGASRYGVIPVKTWIVLGLAVVSQAVGNVLLSASMRSLAAGGTPGAAELPGLLVRAAQTPAVLLGVGFLIVFFVLLAAALSREDLTLVMPAISLEVVVNVLFAARFLGEAVPPQRWAGTAIVAVGIVLVGTTRNVPGGAAGVPKGGAPLCRP